DVAAVTTEIPGHPSSSQLHYYVYDPANNYLTDFYSIDTNGDPTQATLTLPVTGTYTIRVQSYYDYEGEYRLRVYAATPPVQVENEPDDGTSNATAVTFTVSGSTKSATVTGVIASNSDLAYYNLGTINAGQSILLSSRKPSYSGLDPVVAVY